jgi:hypothetical protein
MKTMSPAALENLARVKTFVQDQTAQVLANPQELLKLTPEVTEYQDDETKEDQILLNALRFSELDVFVGIFLQQNRDAKASIRFHSDKDAHPLLHWAVLDDRLEVRVC